MVGWPDILWFFHIVFHLLIDFLIFRYTFSYIIIFLHLKTLTQNNSHLRPLRSGVLICLAEKTWSSWSLRTVGEHGNQLELRPWSDAAYDAANANCCRWYWNCDNSGQVTCGPSDTFGPMHIQPGRTWSWHGEHSGPSRKPPLNHQLRCGALLWSSPSAAPRLT